MRRVIAGVVAVLMTPLSGLSLAQDATVSGPGFKLNEDTVFHPHVGTEVGAVSNVFYQENGPISSAILRVLAGFDVESIPAEGREGRVGGASKPGRSIDYGVGLHLRYSEYLTSNEVVRTQRGVGISFNGKLVVRPGQPVSFSLLDNYVRDTRSPNFETPGNLFRDINRFVARLQWSPPGRSISASLAYRNVIDLFEDSDLDFANRIQHSLILNTRWRWLPATSFYLRARQGVYGALGTGDLNGDRYVVNSYPLDVRVGADSAITPLTSARLFVGWGVGFYDSGPSYSSPVYGAELAYRYSPLGRATLSFQRKFSDSINANYFSDYRIAAGVGQQISKFASNVRVRYSRRFYDGLPTSIAADAMTTTRVDNVFEAGAELRYFYRDWLSAQVSYDFSAITTGFSYNNPNQDDPDFIRHEVYAGVDATF